MYVLNIENQIIIVKMRETMPFEQDYMNKSFSDQMHGMCVSNAARKNKQRISRLKQE